MPKDTQSVTIACRASDYVYTKLLELHARELQTGRVMYSADKGILRRPLPNVSWMSVQVTASTGEVLEFALSSIYLPPSDPLYYAIGLDTSIPNGVSVAIHFPRL